MKNNNKTIYLHLGLPKTGTTAIQNFLFHNKEELAASGLIYPTIDSMHLDEKTSNLTSANLRQILFRNLDKSRGIEPVFLEKSNRSIELYKERFDRFFLDQILESEGNILFSEEIFANIASSHYFVTMLKEHAFDVKIIAYVRPAAEWVAARWSEEVLNGAAYPLETYLKQLPCVEEIKRLIFYTSFIGKENVIVKPYERCQWKDESLIADFLDIFSLSISPSHRIPEVAHTTAGRNTTEIMRIMGHFGGLNIQTQAKFMHMMKNQKVEDTKIIETLSDDEIFNVTTRVNEYYTKLASIYDKVSFFVNEYPDCYETTRPEYSMINFNSEQSSIFVDAINTVREEKNNFLETIIRQNDNLIKENEILRAQGQATV